jgi:hypothetical protein
VTPPRRLGGRVDREPPSAAYPVGQPWPRYVCVRCGRDWTTYLENIADSPGTSLDALCECDRHIAAQEAQPGVSVIEGLAQAH